MKKQTLKPTEAGLTTMGFSNAELAAEGIEPKLSIGDLVEVIAQEKYNEGIALLEAMEKEGKDLVEEFKNIFNPTKESFIKKTGLKIPISTVVLTSSFLQGNKNANYLRIQQLNFVEQADKVRIEVYQNGVGYIPSTKEVVLECNAVENHPSTTTTKNGVTKTVSSSTNYKSEIRTSSAGILAVAKKIEAYNEKVLAFYTALPKKSISLSSMIRDIKTKVNKEIIKKQAPNVTEQVKQLFGITL